MTLDDVGAITSGPYDAAILAGREADRLAAALVPATCSLAELDTLLERVHDLSMSGAYLATPTPFLEGTLLSLDVELPTGRLVGKGEVVYAKTADVRAEATCPMAWGSCSAI